LVKVWELPRNVSSLGGRRSEHFNDPHSALWHALVNGAMQGCRRRLKDRQLAVPRKPNQSGRHGCATVGPLDGRDTTRFAYDAARS
jgi:hypothetical protein